MFVFRSLAFASLWVAALAKSTSKQTAEPTAAAPTINGQSSHYKRIPTVETYGNKFFYSNNGSQFFLRGIAYQPDYNIYAKQEGWDHLTKSYIDPLAIPELCQRDIDNLRLLNINTVRVYAIDPKADHNYCMDLFAENHIYVMVDLSEPKNSIVRDAPTWDLDLYERYTSVVTAMQKYNNVLGFFAGNEVISSTDHTAAAPYVKASIRDTKEFIKKKNYRQIPVGYSTNDDAKTRDLIKKYFVCGDNQAAKADFIGINNYEWCGHSTFRTSGYAERLEDFKSYPVPVFFSEFGCNTVRPRPFTEIDALYSPFMTDVFSGGIMYMYFEEPNNYGVVQAEDLTNLTSAVVQLDEFKYLQYQYSKANPLGINKKTQMQSKEKINCPIASFTWQASNILPETPDAFKCDCVLSALSCVQSPLIQLTAEDVKSVYSVVCQNNTETCNKLKGDGSRGEYGIYSSCRRSQRLSIAMNEYYFKNGQQKSSCAFEGKGIIVETRNDVQSLSQINDPINANKDYTCYAAIGGAKHIGPLYGMFDAKNQSLIEKKEKNGNKPHKGKGSAYQQTLKSNGASSMIHTTEALFCLIVGLWVMLVQL